MGFHAARDAERRAQGQALGADIEAKAHRAGCPAYGRPRRQTLLRVVSMPPGKVRGRIMTTADASSAPFDIGRVIQQTIAVLGRNIASFSILGLILVGLPTALVGIVQFTWLHQAMPGLMHGAFDISPDVVVGSSFGGLVLLIT